LAKAEKLGVPTLLIEKGRFFQGDGYIPELRAAGIDFVVLAGFLWKIPPALVATYPQKMVNIHPALLPKFGGKGMYGANVHAAVLAAGETETGITIHYVNEHYDEGGTIFQARCPIVAGETPESLAAKVHALEHAHFAKVIEGVIKGIVC
jgi:phosphoribosylglycinamide formyltransferase-1